MPAVENKSYCISVFLDYRACFDTICREILINKLERYEVRMFQWFQYGVRGVGLQYIKAYFENRMQYVCYKSHMSETVTQKLGIINIQGSKTGPMYFDIYCNEFHRVLGDDQYILYGDDTSMVCLCGK